MEALAEAKRREQSAERRAERERYAMNPAELMRGARYAAKHATRLLPRVSEDEIDALAQLVALEVWERGAERGEAGRNYLRRVANTIRERRGEEWRDCAADYRESRERSRGEQSSTFQLEGAAEGSWLAVALARESERQSAERPAALPEDLRELARAMAEAESESPSERDALAAALLAKLPAPESGEMPNGVALAALLGVSHAAARKRVSRGAALWRKRYPNPAALAALMRATAAALGSEQRSGEPHVWRAARLAVEAVAAERKRDGAPHGGYSPATVRAARRNLRAERATGRYGASYPDALRPASGAHRLAALGACDPVPTAAERKRAERKRRERNRAATVAARERRAFLAAYGAYPASVS